MTLIELVEELLLKHEGYKEYPYKELSVYSDEPFEIVRESYHRGGRGIDGKQSLTWTPMNKMSDNWLEACIRYNFERGMGESFANSMYIKELDYRKLNNITLNK